MLLFYIISGIKKDTIVYLHRFVMKADKDDVVDHKKHNTYDNRKKFLRKQQTRHIGVVFGLL